MAGIYILSNQTQKYIGQDKHLIGEKDYKKLQVGTNRVFAHYGNALVQDRDNAVAVFTKASSSAMIHLQYTDNVLPVVQSHLKKLSLMGKKVSGTADSFALDVAEIAYIAQALSQGGFTLLNYQGGGQGNYQYDPSLLITTVSKENPKIANEIQNFYKVKPYIYYNFAPNVYNSGNFFSPEKTALGMATAMDANQCMSKDISAFLKAGTINSIRNNVSSLLSRYGNKITIQKSNVEDQTAEINKIFLENINKTLKKGNNIYKIFNIQFDFNDFHMSKNALTEINKEVKTALASSKQSISIPTHTSVVWDMKAASSDLPEGVKQMPIPQEDGTGLLKACAVQAFSKLYKRTKGRYHKSDLLYANYKHISHIEKCGGQFYDEQMAFLKKQDGGPLRYKEIIEDEGSPLRKASFYRTKLKEQDHFIELFTADIDEAEEIITRDNALRNGDFNQITIG